MGTKGRQQRFSLPSQPPHPTSRHAKRRGAAAPPQPTSRHANRQGAAGPSAAHRQAARAPLLPVWPASLPPERRCDPRQPTPHLYRNSPSVRKPRAKAGDRRRLVRMAACFADWKAHCCSSARASKRMKPEQRKVATMSNAPWGRLTFCRDGEERRGRWEVGKGPHREEQQEAQDCCTPPLPPLHACPPSQRAAPAMPRRRARRWPAAGGAGRRR